MAKKYIVTPAGRLIYGSTTELITKDIQNRPLPDNKHHYYVGVAFSKTDPAVNAFLGEVMGYAASEYSAYPAIQTRIQNFLTQDFSMKISDGDVPNKKGTVNENAKGCWVVHMSSTFPIKCANSRNIDIPNEEIKRGFYVDVYVGLGSNGLTDDSAGIYINPQIIRLLGYGPEIFGGISAESAFANAPAQLPQGATALPQATQGFAVPIQPQPAQQPAAFPGFAPQPQVQPVQQQGFTPQVAQLAQVGLPPFAQNVNTGQPVQNGIPSIPGLSTTVLSGNPQHPPHPQILGFPTQQ